MAQHDYVIANGTGAAVRSDLNNALAAIVSQNSGATAPATTYAFQFWADTTTGLLKLRNSANSAWVTLFQLDGEWSTLPVENGTAAAPSIYFKDSGTDTGFYSPGTDQIGISTGGTARLTIDANGNLAVDTNSLYVDAANNRVGIGDSAPTARLVCNGSIQVTSTTNATTGAGLEIGYGAVNPSRTALQSYNRTGSAWLGADYNALDHRFYISGGGSPQMTLTSTGLGIGTQSPDVNFVVSNGGTSSSASGGTLARVVGSGVSRLDIVGGNTNYSILEFSRANLTAAGQLSYEHSTNSLSCTVNGNQEAWRVDSSKRLLVGTSSSFASCQLEINAAAQSIAARSNNDAADFARYQAGGFGSFIFLRKSRNATLGSHTIVNNGDSLGGIEFSGSDGTNFITAARIAAEVDGTPGTNDMPGRLVFSTTADGASSLTERMRISNVGDVGVGTASPEVRLHVSETNNDNPCFIDALNASFSNNSIVTRVVRSSNSAYRFLLCEGGALTGSYDVEFNLRGDGQAYADGSWNGGGADYAEYFEWSDSNPDEEDRRGVSVVLDGNKIREAVSGEDPIGVISGNPSVVGDAAWNKWSGKYLRDEFGSYLLDENGDRQLNPTYDPDQEYIPREQRPEWDCVGLMGKLRIRKGQVTGSRWIKMRDISDSVEEWLVR